MKRAFPEIAQPGERSSGLAAMEVSDGQLIARSRSEPEWFTALFQRHAGKLARYVTRRLGADLAEDIVAETFLTAFRQRGRYDVSRHDAGPWLYGIAGNLIRGHRRDELRRLRAVERTGPGLSAESITDQVEDRLMAAAASRAIAAAIASLSDGQRDVVLLITWAELTYDQVAETLGVPEGTVRSRMHRARAELRAALSDLNPARYLDDKEHNDGRA